MADASLRALYEAHGAHILRRCRYLLGNDDDAWDAVQEVFLRAERGLKTFEGRSSELTWLMRIATHHCLNRLRAQRTRRGRGHVDLDALDRERPTGHGGVDAERAVMVRNVLRLFDLETQAMAIHYFVDEMNQEEVATATARSVPTVRKRLARFVRIARRELEGGGATAVARTPA